MKIRKLFAFLLAVSLLVTSLAGCADILPLKPPPTEPPIPDPDYLSYTVKDGKATVTAADQTISGSIEIPATLGGHPVTAIGDCAFILCQDLESIIIPEGVTHIGISAFLSCNSLRSISIPDSLTYVGDGAFSACTKLQYNIYENGNYLGNASNPYVILISSISKDMTSFNVHRATKCIYEHAFHQNKKLTEITLHDGLTSIGGAAFFNCTSLKAITIPESVLEIGFSAFSDCSSLETINIPNGIESIEGAFGSCDNLQYNIYNGGKYLGSAKNPYILFLGVDPPDITSYSINPATKFIDEYAFNGRGALTDITIPNSVVHIGDGAFLYCESLVEITIPDSVKSIGGDAFWKCTSLKMIHLPDNMERIGSRAFYGCSALESIRIPNGVQRIEENTFNSCTSLKSITIPSSVVEIDGAPFRTCSALQDIFYCGSEADWEKIDIYKPITEVPITYNYAP